MLSLRALAFRSRALVKRRCLQQPCRQPAMLGKWEPEEGARSSSLAAQLQGWPRGSSIADETGSRRRHTPPPMYQQKPALKAGFLLSGIPRHCGISRHSAGATPRQNVARNSPSSTLLCSHFSTSPHQLVVVGTRRIPDTARSYAGVAESGWERRLEQQSG